MQSVDDATATAVVKPTTAAGTSSSQRFPRQQTLHHEGIRPASVSAIAGSRFGRAKASPYRFNAQQMVQDRSNNSISSSSSSNVNRRRSMSSIVTSNSSIGGVSSVSTAVTGISSKSNITNNHHNNNNSSSNNSRRQSADYLFHVLRNVPQCAPRINWTSLGEGWWQVTPPGSGSTTRFGLHSVIESAANAVFLCLYEPRSAEAVAACTGTAAAAAEYNLEMHVKIQSKVMNGNIDKQKQSFQIVFAYKSSDDYCSIVCDARSQMWYLIHTINGQDVLIKEVEDSSIKLHSFCHLLLQIRGQHVSIDANGTPLLTNVRVPDAEGSWDHGVGGIIGLNNDGPGIVGFNTGLGGIMGLMSKGTRFAVKGWKLLGVTPRTAFKSAIDSREIITAPAATSATVNAAVATHRSAPTTPSRNNNNNNNNNNSSSKSSGSGRTMSLSDALSAKQSNNAHQHFVAAKANTSHLYQQPNAKYQAIFQQHQQMQKMLSSYSSNNNNSNSNIDSCSSNGMGWRSYEESSGKISLPPPPPLLLSTAATTTAATTATTATLVAPFASDRLLTATQQLLNQGHEAAMIDSVLRDVVLNSLVSDQSQQQQQQQQVSFDDIASLETAKRLLNEAVVLPLIMPEFFTGIREPWKGVLLFGPPGTGKTLLAKALCCTNHATFFSCSAASLISKYRGDSEKIVRCLFAAARSSSLSPSVIFLDEVDALVSKRSGADCEHEASRRLKTEFFAQMDGLNASTVNNSTAVAIAGANCGAMGSNSGSAIDSSGSSCINSSVSSCINSSSSGSVMVLATTNCPWDLDSAMVRRLQKRIYVPLPDLSARQQMFSIFLRSIPTSEDVQLQQLATLTDGFSGADVFIACKDAAMMPMRRLLDILSPADLMEMRKAGELTVPKVMMSDFVQSIGNTKPSVTAAVVERYLQWDAEFRNI